MGGSRPGRPPGTALGALLRAAARGEFPPPDGTIAVVDAPPGPAAAVVGFTGHVVVAADVDPAAVAARAPAGALTVPLSAGFLGWLGEQTGARPGSHDVVLCAGRDDRGSVDWLVPVDPPPAHPRVAEARRQRDELVVWAAGDDGIVILGRGLCGRCEMSFEVEPAARGRGLGRRLAAAARALVAPGETVWAQVAPGNAASLRAVTAAGYVPVAAEVLFRR